LLWATRTTLNVQSLVGLLFMVGIAVSNSVLLVEFAARLREQGRSPADAAAESAAVRLRPILMTSLAAVLGLVPMAIGFGHGGEANVPLARAVVGGLTASTLLTLFVVPVADAWLHRNDVLKAPDLEGPNVEAIP
ncbi:MAG TPA: efflux RND transporter permease subunit, partial [Polyangiaceae bacterium]|nr:efflux RND transporter permease subunit [Polyangiaceae bacterium]